MDSSIAAVGAFAVCAGNVCAGHSAMGLAQIFGKDADVFNTEFLHRHCGGEGRSERSGRDSSMLARCRQFFSK